VPAYQEFISVPKSWADNKFLKVLGQKKTAALLADGESA
jgi:hypothetical protein